MRLALVTVLALLAAGCVQAPVDAPREDAPGPADGSAPSGYAPNLFLLEGPRPPGATVHGGSEPMILADRDGEWLWVASTGGGSRSRDNGTTWERLPGPFFLTADGWSLAQDDLGRLYATTTGIPYVEVYRSDTDGASWVRPGLPARGPASGIVDVAPVADRPWIAARGDGELMLIFYDFGRATAESCVRSTDGGATWPDRDPSAGAPNAGRAEFDMFGRFAYTSSAGTMHVFGNSTLAGSRCLGTPGLVPMFAGGKGVQTQLHTTSAGNALYTAAPGPGNAFVTLSGWIAGAAPKELRVSPPDLKVNAYATLSASDDEVVVAWYGTETGGAWNQPGFAGSWNVYVARVTDFWSATPTVEFTRLTTEPNHVGDICTGGVGCTGASDRDLLDYFGVDHDIWGGAHVSYVHDGAGSSAEVRYAHLA